MKRTMTIRIERTEAKALQRMRKDFMRAWTAGKYQGEDISFASPQALFRAITPTRWTVIEVLQRLGPSTLRGLARNLNRDVKGVHRDVHALIALGLIEKDESGRVLVPFTRIYTKFELAQAA